MWTWTAGFEPAVARVGVTTFSLTSILNDRLPLVISLYVDARPVCRCIAVQSLMWSDVVVMDLHTRQYGRIFFLDPRYDLLLALRVLPFNDSIWLLFMSPLRWMCLWCSVSLCKKFFATIDPSKHGGSWLRRPRSGWMTFCMPSFLLP